MESIKEKLKIKPSNIEREPVVIVLQGPTQGIPAAKKTVIVDETSKGYDRATLMRKFATQRLLKVGSLQEQEKPEQEIKEPKKIEEEETIKIVTKAPKKITKAVRILETSDKEEGNASSSSGDEEILVVPKKKRITKKPEKGVAILGPESMVQMDLVERMPAKQPPVIIKVSNYYMNNREIFIQFINSLFEPYRREMEENQENISCDNIGKTSTDFSLLTHQKIVRDYMNVFTPYRGLLLYHGLGSGKTCTSIAIAEGMKNTNRVIIMTPASLRANYIEELKKCGDLLYKRTQFWEWISVKTHPKQLETLSALLNLPQTFIQKNGGAFFVNVSKASNYDVLTGDEKQRLEDQLDEMIRQKYTFINYNGLRAKKLSELTSKYTVNIFDHSVIVIDEAHNLIRLIVNKLKKEKPISGKELTKKELTKKEKAKEAAAEGKDKAAVAEGKEGKEEKEKESIFGEKIPLQIATKLYYMMLRAKNARFVLLSGTPVINYPNEFAVLFNILRGYIQTWKIPLIVKTENKINQETLRDLLLGEKSLDYLEYSPSTKLLTLTRNPFGFKNRITKDKKYKGVYAMEAEAEEDDDATFERKIISILRKNNLDVVIPEMVVENKKALPDDLETFLAQYIDGKTQQLMNTDALKRRIIGLSSYFKSAQENLLPKYENKIGVDYHLVRIPMSDMQFKLYESARKEERKVESSRKKPAGGQGDNVYDKVSASYRIFSRLYCNYILLDRPVPDKDVKGKTATKEEDLGKLLKDAEKAESKQDVEDENIGEKEGDEIMEELGGADYKERMKQAMDQLREKSNDFLTPEALQTYSPKYLHMLENIQDPEHVGLHLVYSQFRTAEGIGIFSMVLEKNGFAPFRIKRNVAAMWELDIAEVDKGKPMYALYTGTETTEEKEIIRHIYNGEWDQLPDAIANALKASHHNNHMGEVIKVLMITSSGSEGINLKNTRYVHIMEPYWHPVRVEQVIGRARRICSHNALPKELQTVEVFVYIMIFSEAQLKSDNAIELKRKDLSKGIPHVPITSDQYLYEISEIKAKVTGQLTEVIKETAFDCYVYSKGRCMNFGNPTNESFSYVPDYAQQQGDTTVRANTIEREWTGKTIKLGHTWYVYKRITDRLFDLYDKDIYERAAKDPTIEPLRVGSYTINERGEVVVKLI
jgi:hypothetical protein